MAEVVEINDLETLAGYRLLWNSLLPRTRMASFFQSIDWLETYWRHFGEGQKLRVLVVQSAGQPIGILPLVVRSEPTRLGRVKVLTYPLHDWGSFYGPIGSNPTATLLAGLGHIRRTPRDWDVLDLRWINHSQCDFGRTPSAMQAKGFPAMPGEVAQCASIALTGSWDQYWATRKTHWRTNVRRSERRLAEAGEVQYVRYRPTGSAAGDDDPRWDLYDQCEAIARTSWQGSSSTGTTLTHDAVRSFLRDAHGAAVRAGAADLNLLYVAGEPVAFNYGYHYRGYVFGLRMGHDASRGLDGAGTVLLKRVIEDSFTRGDTTLDLGADYLECKRHWWTHVEPSRRYIYFPPTDPRAQVLRVKRQVQSWWHNRTAVAK